MLTACQGYRLGSDRRVWEMYRVGYLSSMAAPWAMNIPGVPRSTRFLEWQREHGKFDEDYYYYEDYLA